MAAIRSIADIARKYATVTPQRQGEYQSGVEQPLRDWKANSIAAKENWKAGIQAAVTADSQFKGVQRSSTERWKSRTLAKGVTRWGEGVQLGAADFETGFAPFQQAIAALNLPPRFARRDPRNLARVTAVVQAMIATAANRRT